MVRRKRQRYVKFECQFCEQYEIGVLKARKAIVCSSSSFVDTHAMTMFLAALTKNLNILLLQLTVKAEQSNESWTGSTWNWKMKVLGRSLSLSLSSKHYT